MIFILLFLSLHTLPQTVPDWVRYDYASLRFSHLASDWHALNQLASEANTLSLERGFTLSDSGDSASILDCRHVAVLFGVRAVKLSRNEREYIQAHQFAMAMYDSRLSEDHQLIEDIHHFRTSGDWESEIRALAARDQFWRHSLLAPMGSDAWRAELNNAQVWPHICESDQDSTSRIVWWINNDGDFSAIQDSDAIESLFLLVLHSPSTQLQQDLQARAWQAANTGILPVSLAAALTDRISLRQGEQQIYGTQGHCTTSGEWVLSGVFDEASINSARLSAGLSPLSEHVLRSQSLC